MTMNVTRLVAAVLLLITWTHAAQAQDGDSLKLDSATVSVWDIASATVAAVHFKNSIDLKDYYILLCPSGDWGNLAGDGEVGPFVVHGGKLPSNLAAVVLPSRMGTMPSFGVFFKNDKPIGLARLSAEAREGATVRDVVRGYLAIPDSITLIDPHPQLFGGKGTVTSDGGTPVIAIQILGRAPRNEGE